MATPPRSDFVAETTSQPDSLPSKPIHSLVLDTGPLIKNDPAVSTLLARTEELFTTPSVIPEIKDAATRTRVETTLLPFLTIRAPGPASIRFITEFARRTGDLAVLSRPDIEILALGYELECERNKGDWRLRNAPGQKGLNGRPKGQDGSAQDQAPTEINEKGHESAGPAAKYQDGSARDQTSSRINEQDPQSVESVAEADSAASSEQPPLDVKLQEMTLADEADPSDTLDKDVQTLQLPEDKQEQPNPTPNDALPVEDSDSDSDGWITPSNLKRHQAQDAAVSTPSLPPQMTLQAAILTSDYAMQNVALRMNLNLVTPALTRITHLKTWVLRCHGCFSTTKDTDKQFCPKCGQATLTRASCSTDQHGRFRIHLKKNFQWNNRGNVYSVPKATHGSANGRLPKNAGGGKNGWGRDLILAEDQKEYVRASEEQKRQRRKDLMDEDYLPGLLGGKRTAPGGKIRVGAGRNVNSKRKH